MYILNYIFGFSGRFRRMDYWIITFVMIGIWMAVSHFFQHSAVMQWLIDIKMHRGTAPPEFTPDMKRDAAVIGAAALFVFWIGVAAAVKRFHDFGSSGWNYFWFMVPLVNIWFGIKLAFFRGQDQDNAYGMTPYR